MSDDLDEDLADEVEPDVTMLVLEDGENGLEVDDPSRRLSTNERVGLMVRGLLLELAPDWPLSFEQDDE